MPSRTSRLGAAALGALLLAAGTTAAVAHGPAAGDATLACGPGAPGRLFPDSALHAREDWYGKHVRAAGQGALCPLPAGVDEAYRFVWLRTFHAPVVVRVERRGAAATLHAVRLGGAGGYDPKGVVHDTTRALTAAEWAGVEARLRAARFWPPDAAPGVRRDEGGCDGAQWVVEGARGGRYRAMDRWTPAARGPDAAYRALGLYLAGVAGEVPADVRLAY